ncbi:hypothetical protein HA402_003442 [Bradysia odoriphaga]|nr:hypothetical protein HA402_003442 [Bradysia odoriphaga]
MACEIDAKDSQLEKESTANGNGKTDEEQPDTPSLADSSLLSEIFLKQLNTTFEALKLDPDLLRGLPIIATGNSTTDVVGKSATEHDPLSFWRCCLVSTRVTITYRVVCLSPTYELAVQTVKVATNLGKYKTDLKCRLAIFGEEVPQNRQLTEHIVIGTPGKILDWGLKFKVFDIKKISVLVVDEPKSMIATQGYRDQCIRKLPYHCQMIFFSATYDQEVMSFAEIVVPYPTIVRLNGERDILDNIRQYYVRCANQEEKYAAITNIYGLSGRYTADSFYFRLLKRPNGSEQLSQDGHSVGIL